MSRRAVHRPALRLIGYIGYDASQAHGRVGTIIAKQVSQSTSTTE